MIIGCSTDSDDDWSSETMGLLVITNKSSTQNKNRDTQLKRTIVVGQKTNLEFYEGTLR